MPQEVSHQIFRLAGRQLARGRKYLCSNEGMSLHLDGSKLLGVFASEEGHSGYTGRHHAPVHPVLASQLRLLPSYVSHHIPRASAFLKDSVTADHRLSV